LLNLKTGGKPGEWDGKHTAAAHPGHGMTYAQHNSAEAESVGRGIDSILRLTQRCNPESSKQERFVYDK
jgi:hypothetical protein